ncbi:MAG: aminotransferase class I/II-fold pyridoxal phosphate-dependent enzyme [Thermotaleaceae bacterium]
MEQSIFLKNLWKHTKENRISFHVPGHKNGRILERYVDNDFLQRLPAFDQTEIYGLDNLHAPEGIIEESQKKAAAFFGADESFFLVDGSSCGILSAIMAATQPGDQILIPRDCHKSVISGVILGDLHPIYIKPHVDTTFHVPAGIEPETIQKFLMDYPRIKAVLLTYPNYYGICSDIEEIIKIAHQHDKIVIIDEAHGAHLNLSNRLPISALSGGADIVIQSTHKTLPAFTQASMLHVQSNRVDRQRLKFMLSMHQSSSPSYLLMTSLDIARTIAQREGKHLMEDLLDHIENFHKKLIEESNIQILTEVSVGINGVQDIDKTKMLMDGSNIGIRGAALEEFLRTGFNIQMELTNLTNVLAVTSIGNEEKDFQLLLQGLRKIEKEKGTPCRRIFKPLYTYEIPKMHLRPREAVYQKKKEVVFLQSSGKISGEYIIPYPPGIPILCPGEEITKEMIEYVKTLKTEGISIIGTRDHYLEKIDIIEI